MSRTYYSEVDGLRAIAILSVLLFHIFPDLVPGGYVGVDIFFVISGFLITKSVFNDVQNSSFSILDFYVRRILRIFPLLITVLLVTQLVGYFVLHRNEYFSLTKHIFSGAFFISNISLSREAGYFDVASDTKPLLHLWSLSIEEQFYILLPCIILIIKKYNNTVRVNVILLTLLVSFFWAIYYHNVNREHAFYAFSARSWELLFGVLLSIFFLNYDSYNLLNRHRKLVLTVGLFFIIIPVIVYSGVSNLSPLALLVPVIGATLALAASIIPGSPLTVLSNPVFSALGRMSFSLYLWHWPVFVLLKIYYIGTLNISVRVAAILITLLLSILSYKFIEQPILQVCKRKAMAILLSTLLFSLGLGNLVYTRSSEGSKDFQAIDASADFYAEYQNFPKGRWLREFEKNFRHECNFFDVDSFYLGKYTRLPKTAISESCYVADPSKKNKLFIWGDSHAQMYFHGLSNHLSEDWQILQIASSGCNASVTNIEIQSSDYCRHSNAFALSKIESLAPDVLVVAQSQDHSVSEMRLIAKSALKFGVKQVIFIGPAPRWTDDLPKIVARKLLPDIPERTREGLNIRFFDKNNELKRKFVSDNRVHYFDVISLFCNSDGCLTGLTNADNKFKLTTWDYGHLTDVASDFVGEKLSSFIRRGSEDSAF